MWAWVDGACVVCGWCVWCGVCGRRGGAALRVRVGWWCEWRVRVCAGGFVGLGVLICAAAGLECGDAARRSGGVGPRRRRRRRGRVACALLVQAVFMPRAEGVGVGVGGRGVCCVCGRCVWLVCVGVGEGLRCWCASGGGASGGCECVCGRGGGARVC